MTIIKDPGNQAESYSDSQVRQWRQTSGLWKTDYGTSQGQLGTCSTNLTNMTNDRNYWKTTVAHDDPAVWDNRYNAGHAAGYSAADTAESPRALSNYTFTATIPAHNGTMQTCTLTGAGAAGVLTNNGTSLTAHRPGYWSVYMLSSGYNNVTARIFTEGVQRATQGDTPNAPDWLPGIGAHWVGFINAGGSISFQGRSQTGTWGGSMTVTFIPSPGYQQ
jgi:hypothetical protein